LVSVDFGFTAMTQGFGSNLCRSSHFQSISTELIGTDPEFQYGSAVSVWASVASVKFPHGSKIVICNPRMEIPDASVSIRGSSGKLCGGRDSGRRRFWFFFANWGNFSALGTSPLFSEL
jgi:hypothetical protein